MKVGATYTTKRVLVRGKISGSTVEVLGTVGRLETGEKTGW